MRIKKSIFLTGATGVIGSHVLYELLRLKEIGNFTGKLILLARPCKEVAPAERIKKVLHPSLIPDYLKEIPKEHLLKDIHIIGEDLREAKTIASQIEEDQFIVIHLASSVNLSPLKRANDEIVENNYHGSINLIANLIDRCCKFVYVSTAYSSGHREGMIDDDYLNFDDKHFRNPYEKYKAATEAEVKKICTEKGVTCQILRPSIVCGRMIDPPLYVIPRYLVFYLFGAFFHKMAMTGSRERLRIQINRQSGMNIVPVDYTAKAIVRAITRPIEQLNIVHSKNIPNENIISTVFSKTGIVNWEYTTEIPKDMNKLERLYYCTVGSQFNPYWNTFPHHFSAKKVRKLLHDIPEPDVQNCFDNVFEHAYHHRFVDALQRIESEVLA